MPVWTGVQSGTESFSDSPFFSDKGAEGKTEVADSGGVLLWFFPVCLCSFMAFFTLVFCFMPVVLQAGFAGNKMGALVWRDFVSDGAAAVSFSGSQSGHTAGNQDGFFFCAGAFRVSERGVVCPEHRNRAWHLVYDSGAGAGGWKSAAFQ